MIPHFHLSKKLKCSLVTKNIRAARPFRIWYCEAFFVSFQRDLRVERQSEMVQDDMRSCFIYKHRAFLSRSPARNHRIICTTIYSYKETHCRVGTKCVLHL